MLYPILIQAQNKDMDILYVPLILQQIQISVDQPYAGPGCQLLRYQRDI
jgi:hypothetical protein